MEITCDPAKQAKTLKERGLDFMDAAVVFAGLTFTMRDDRKDYGEERFISFGYLNARMVAVCWTPRDAARHVFSMRYCHAKEERKVKALMGGP